MDARKLAEDIFRLIERDGGLIKDDLITLIEDHARKPAVVEQFLKGQTWTYTTNRPTVTYFDGNDTRRVDQPTSDTANSVLDCSPDLQSVWAELIYEMHPDHTVLAYEIMLELTNKVLSIYDADQVERAEWSLYEINKTPSGAYMVTIRGQFTDGETVTATTTKEPPLTLPF